MNIFGKIPFLADEKHDDESPEAVEKREKRERIKFHRERVRNGPVKFSFLTSGQVRRIKRRDLEAQTKKSRRKQVDRYFAERQEAMRLRGLLQAAGVLSYHAPARRASSRAAREAIIVLFERFARQEEVTHNEVVASLERALQRYQRLMQEEVTPLSPSYRLPVVVAA